MEQYTFKEPENIYRGIDLWMVNDKLEDDEIKRQVLEFKDKGLGTVIFRTYNGLISDYPGEEFKHKVRVAVDTAKECGLKIVLQAGFMPAAVPDLPREYMLHRINPVKRCELTGEETVLAYYKDMAYTEKTVPAVLNMLDAEAVDYYLLKSYEELWADFKDEFGKTINYVWVDEPRFENRYLVWMTNMEALFYEKYGYSIQENLVSLYHNIGDYKKVRYDYFTFLRERMEKNFYTKVRSWCHENSLMLSGHLMGEERLTMQIAQGVAIMPFYKYFDVPGMDMLRCHHDWYDKPLNSDAGANRTIDMGAVQCVSASEQAGKKHILCEMYGVTSPNLVFRDQMHLFDHFAATGINCQCMHALFYSPRGFRKRFYPQTFNVYQPFWENFRNVKDYVARVSRFVSMGKSAKDILVLHPLETGYGLYRGLSTESDESARAEVDAYDEKYYKLLTDLHSMQIPFQLGDMVTIDSMGSVKDGRFVIGEMSYETVVLSDIEVLSSKTLKLLAAFAQSGGRILVNGSLPERVDGRENTEAAEVLASFASVTVFEDRACFMRAVGKIERTAEYVCEGDAAKIVVNHRKDGEKNYFMIYNGDCRKAKKGALVVEGRHKAFLFDAQRNTVEEIFDCERDGKTIITVEIPVGGSALVFTEPAEEIACVKEKKKGYHVLPIENLSCKPESDNVLTLDLCCYKTAEMNEFSETELDVEHVANELGKMAYTGNVTLRFRFWADFCAKNLRLVIEDPQLCTVNLNGMEVDCRAEGYYYSKAYPVVKLPDAVKNGENIIEVTRFYTSQKHAPIRDDMKHLFELFRAPVGVDLERIHILGEFEVEAVKERSYGPGVLRFADRMFMTEKKELTTVSDITSHGYPFYPGTVCYTAEITCDKKMLNASDIVLKIGEYNGCSAAVYIDGKKAGSINRDPYVLSIKDSLTLGENKLEIRLYGTFRNMIGPSHLNIGDLSGCGRTTWTLPLEVDHSANQNNPSVINSYMLVPYGIGDVRIEIY